MADQLLLPAPLLEGWATYQENLIQAIAPLTPDDLALRAAPQLRSIHQLLTHSIGARARWFHVVLGAQDAETDAMQEWDARNAPPRSASELVQGLRATWAMIQAGLASWTAEEFIQPFRWESDDEPPETFTRAWIIWHLIEHDLHHGGEIGFSLGMHGLRAPDI